MYNDYYNFSLSPFENTPDPRFLSLTPLYREVLAALVYGVDAGKGFMLLAGEAGTGKTTLIRAFLQELDEKHLVVNIFNPRTSFDDIVIQLARKLGRDCQGLSSMAAIDELEDALKQYAVGGRRVALVIDEAHLLSEKGLEDIRLLSNIEDNHQKLVQIILAGQNEINKLLARPSQKSLLQRINISRNLQPMSPAEVQDYINHRLVTANCRAEIFDKKAVDLIVKKSYGIPRLVNQICDNALLIGYASNVKLIDKRIIREVIADMHPVRFRPHNMARWLSQRPLWIIGLIFLLVLLNSFFYKSQNKGDENPPSLNMTIPQENGAGLDMATVAMPASGDGGVDLQESAPVFGESRSSVDRATTFTNGETDDQPALTKESVPEDAGSEDTMSGESVIPEAREAAIQPQSSRTVAIKAGQDIRSLAIEQYGCATETVFDLIQSANPELTSIDHIYVGQQIRLPAITRDSLLVGTGGVFTIHYASFFSKRTAEKVSRLFSHEGWDAKVAPMLYGSTSYYRVLLGPFPEQSTARSKLAQVDFKNLPFLQQPE